MATEITNEFSPSRFKNKSRILIAPSSEHILFKRKFGSNTTLPLSQIISLAQKRQSTPKLQHIEQRESSNSPGRLKRSPSIEGKITPEGSSSIDYSRFIVNGAMKKNARQSQSQIVFDQLKRKSTMRLDSPIIMHEQNKGVFNQHVSDAIPSDQYEGNVRKFTRNSQSSSDNLSMNRDELLQKSDRYSGKLNHNLPLIKTPSSLNGKRSLTVPKRLSQSSNFIGQKPQYNHPNHQDTSLIQIPISELQAQSINNDQDILVQYSSFPHTKTNSNESQSIKNHSSISQRHSSLKQIASSKEWLLQQRDQKFNLTDLQNSSQSSIDNNFLCIESEQSMGVSRYNKFPKFSNNSSELNQQYDTNRNEQVFKFKELQNKSRKSALNPIIQKMNDQPRIIKTPHGRNSSFTSLNSNSLQKSSNNSISRQSDSMNISNHMKKIYSQSPGISPSLYLQKLNPKGTSIFSFSKQSSSNEVSVSSLSPTTPPPLVKKPTSYTLSSHHNTAIKQFLTSLKEEIIEFFCESQFKKFGSSLKNIEFKSSFFRDFIDRIIVSNKISEQQNEKLPSVLHFSFLKEQLRTIGFTPSTTQQISEEIVLYLNSKCEGQLCQISNDHSSSQYIPEIIENINQELDIHLQWTLLDHFGSEQELKQLAIEFLEVLSSDLLCQKILHEYQIDENMIIDITLSVFNRSSVDSAVVEEITKRSNSAPLSYADFFYIKYRLMHFCIEKGISLKIMFAILEQLESVRFALMKKPSSLVIYQNNLMIPFKKPHSQAQQVIDKNPMKTRQSLEQLASSVIERNVSFHPIRMIPQGIVETLLNDQSICSFDSFSKIVVENLERSCFNELDVLIDGRIILSTLQVALGLKKSFNQQINSSITFEELFEKLMATFEERQCFAFFSQLNDRINLRIFSLNLISYLFDVYTENQRCSAFSLDIKAQFQMFGCQNTAFELFMGLIEKEFKQHNSSTIFETNQIELKKKILDILS